MSLNINISHSVLTSYFNIKKPFHYCYPRAVGLGQDGGSAFTLCPEPQFPPENGLSMAHQLLVKDLEVSKFFLHPS